MKQTHQRRDRRDPQPRRMRLTERDAETILAVYNYRVLTLDQIHKLIFRDIQDTRWVQRSLARLYHHKLLARVFLPVITGSSPTMYVLDRKGVELLHTHFGLEDLKWYPSSKTLKTMFLEHTIAINDFRISVTKACALHGYKLRAWVTESEVKAHIDRVTVRSKRGTSRKIPIVPDSYFILDTPKGRAHFFLELDRSTMPSKSFRSKVAGFIEYYKSGAYERQYKTKSLSVLTVTTSQRRLNNLKRVTEDEGGKDWFLFGVLDELTPEVVLTSPIWKPASQDNLVSLI